MVAYFSSRMKNGSCPSGTRPVSSYCDDWSVDGPELLPDSERGCMRPPFERLGGGSVRGDGDLQPCVDMSCYVGCVYAEVVPAFNPVHLCVVVVRDVSVVAVGDAACLGRIPALRDGLVLVAVAASRLCVECSAPSGWCRSGMYWRLWCLDR